MAILISEHKDGELIARIAMQKLSTEQLLAKCTPRLALAVEAFRREEAGVRAEVS